MICTGCFEEWDASSESPKCKCNSLIEHLLLHLLIFFGCILITCLVGFLK